jgi:hypothetical protein
MIPSIASRIPLVRRPKAPALPLDERITHLTGLTVAPAGAGHQIVVTRVSGVLNYAALIASDVGLPDLAADLCWRQHRVFADARRLTGGIAVMSLMPLINISRLLTREGDGKAAYDVLTRLYRAAQKREAAEIHGHTVDLAALIDTDTDHRKVCEELWITVLVDGARALARIGRWTEAAEAMTSYRGIGNRLLDGRQIEIMALMERGLGQQARDTIDATTPTEPWENTIAALLHVYCRPPSAPVPRPDLDLVLSEVATLVAEPDPSTAVFQTRAALAALDLTRDRTSPSVGPLNDALANTAALDAFAARDVLTHAAAGPSLTSEHHRQLVAAVAASGLGAGRLPEHHMHALTEAVDKGEVALRSLL